jgi:hypothetical protein
LLYTIHEPVNKDTELHPLVRWQFRGGIPEHKRKAFLFKHVVDSAGRRYAGDVVVGALAATPEIYRIGMNAPSLKDIGPLWEKAIANPIPPVVVDRAHAPCQEVIIEGQALQGRHARSQAPRADARQEDERLVVEDGHGEIFLSAKLRRVKDEGAEGHRCYFALLGLRLYVSLRLIQLCGLSSLSIA